MTTKDKLLLKIITFISKGLSEKIVIKYETDIKGEVNQFSKFKNDFTNSKIHVTDDVRNDNIYTNSALREYNYKVQSGTTDKAVVSDLSKEG